MHVHSPLSAPHYACRYVRHVLPSSPSLPRASSYTAHHTSHHPVTATPPPQPGAEPLPPPLTPHRTCWLAEMCSPLASEPMRTKSPSGLSSPFASGRKRAAV